MGMSISLVSSSGLWFDPKNVLVGLARGSMRPNQDRVDPQFQALTRARAILAQGRQPQASKIKQKQAALR